jgi:hypothetical protein
MNFHYTYYPQMNLFIQQVEGEWDFEIYFNFIRKIESNVPWNDVRFILSDFRETLMPKTQKDIDNIPEIYKIREYVKLHNVKHTYLVGNPGVTAFFMMYAKENKRKDIKYSFCSTLSRTVRLIEPIKSEEECFLYLNNLIPVK